MDERYEAERKDGTRVNGLVTLPDQPGATKPYPMLLWIHGGPNGQDAHAFSAMRQLFSARGYAVLNVNYRGSNGRGIAPMGVRLTASTGCHVFSPDPKRQRAAQQPAGITGPVARGILEYGTKGRAWRRGAGYISAAVADISLDPPIARSKGHSTMNLP